MSGATVCSVESPYLLAPEAAAYIRRTKKALYHLVGQGKVKPAQGGRGKKMLFTKEALDAFVAGDEVPAVAP